MTADTDALPSLSLGGLTHSTPLLGSVRQPRFTGNAQEFYGNNAPIFLGYDDSMQKVPEFKRGLSLEDPVFERATPGEQH